SKPSSSTRTTYMPGDTLAKVQTPCSSASVVSPLGEPAWINVHVAPGIASCWASVTVIRRDRRGGGCCAHTGAGGAPQSRSTPPARAANGIADLSIEYPLLYRVSAHDAHKISHFVTVG